MADRPTILLVTNNLPPVLGGSAVVYDNLARHAGGQITVLAPHLSYQDGLPLIGWREHDRLAPYRVTRRPLLRTIMRDSATAPDNSGWRRLGWRATDTAIRAGVLASVLRLVLTGGVRAVCVGELITSAWLLKALRLLTPWVTRAVYVHGEEITIENSYDRGQRRRRAALKVADQIIVVSRFTAAQVAALLPPAAASRIKLLENGVDTVRFRPLPKPQDLHAQYGLAGAFTFISVCRLLEKKGIDHAIRAFARLARDFPECRYLIVGTGPFLPTLKSIAAEEGVADRIIFAGMVAADALPEHYALGDVFIMPNRKLPDGDTEGFGLVFLEANSCGLPVIAGQDGGSVDAVRDNINGLVVNGAAIDAIEAAMRALHTNPALRDQLRQGGLAAAAAADWRHKAAHFVSLLRSPR